MNTHNSSHWAIAVDFDLVPYFSDHSNDFSVISKSIVSLASCLIQFQGDPVLDIKDEPEAWSVTVDKKVRINNSLACACSFNYCCSSCSFSCTLLSFHQETQRGLERNLIQEDF